MARNTIPRALILEREKRVWHLRTHGYTYEAIGKEIGITFSGVANILNRMHNRYLAHNMADVEKCRQEQICSLGNVSKEAFDAWERSKKTKVIKKKRALGKDGKYSGGIQSSEEIYEQEGDPRYLQVFLKAQEDLRKITGADSPAKHELTGKDGKAINIEDPNKVDAREELRLMLAKAFINKPTVIVEE